MSLGLPTSQKYFCLTAVCTLISIPVVSIYFVVALSIHRFQIVCDPINFLDNKNKCPKLAIALCTLKGVLFGFLPLLGWRSDTWDGTECIFVRIMDENYMLVFVLIELLLPFLTIFIIYGMIVGFMAYRSSKQRSSPSQTSRERPLGQQQVVTRNVGIIVAVFLMSWLPLGSIDLYNYICDGCFKQLDVMNFAIVISHSSAAINPMIYAYRIREIRDALQNLIARK